MTGHGFCLRVELLGNQVFDVNRSKGGVACPDQTIVGVYYHSGSGRLFAMVIR